MKDLKYRAGIFLLVAFALTSLRPTNAKIFHLNKKAIRTAKKSSWQLQLENEFKNLEKLHPNQVGIFIKDLNSGEEYSFHAEENWYLASTVKVPVAMEVLRQVDAGKIKLDEKMEILEDDFIDGNGPLNYKKPGTFVTISYLIEQMIIWSDNTATDMLLRKIGVENVNELIKAISPEGFSKITTLKDVRRHVYGGIHPKAFELSGSSFIELRKIPDPAARIAKLSALLSLDNNQEKTPTLHDAYQTYYKNGLNSASPRKYSRILETLWEGKVLSSSSRDFLVQTMLKTQTGKKRIAAGLKRPWVFAHKTGTQYQRIGDVGYLMNPHDVKRKPIIVVSFVRDVPEEKSSAEILEKVAKIISKSGLL